MTLPNRRPLIHINPGQRYKPTWQTRLKAYAAEIIINLLIIGAMLATLVGVGFLAWWVMGLVVW